MKVKHLLHCHLLVKGLLPELVATAPRLPGLEALLAIAHQRSSTEGGAAAWLCNAFGVARQNDWPIAPFAALGDGLVPEGQYWLCATPVHFHLLRDRYTIADSVPFDLTLEESRALVASLNQHFSADHLQFFAPHANRWYLCMAQPPALKTHLLVEVIGEDVNRLLPQGADAMQWHGWLNEMQMLLHDHPVNLERERQGKLMVNSLWLWGGGVLPQAAGSPFADVWADDVLVRGLTHASAQILPFSAWEWLEKPPTEGAHLMVLDDLRKADLRTDVANWHEALGRLERHWFAPMREALKSGQVVSLHLHLVQSHSIKSFAVARHDFWKFWQRAKPLRASMD